MEGKQNHLIYSATKPHSFDSGSVLVAPNRVQYPPPYDHNAIVFQDEPVSDESAEVSIISPSPSKSNDPALMEYIKEEAVRQADLAREARIEKNRSAQEKYLETGNLALSEHIQDEGPVLQNLDLQGESTPESTPGK